MEGRRNMDWKCIYKESLAEGCFRFDSDPEGLFSYMCFRLDRVKFVALAAMLFIVMSACLLSRFLADKISDTSAELEAIRRQTGESIEMEKMRTSSCRD